MRNPKKLFPVDDKVWSATSFIFALMVSILVFLSIVTSTRFHHLSSSVVKAKLFFVLPFYYRYN